MKKKLLFTAYSMGLGGIETALCNLLNRLDYDTYDVTLILERKEGIFLDQIPKQVKVLEYKISDDKNVAKRKIKNRLKLIQWKRKLKNKFDFSCCFATYSIPGAHLALAASKNSHLWVHLNYYITYKENEAEMAKFFDGVMAPKFKRIVFVSEENRREVCKHYDKIVDKSYVCNNFINGEDVLEKAKEEVDFKKGKETLFVNVGRHDEYQKRLTRIIDAANRLKRGGYKFKILFIGDGEEHQMYEELIETLELQDTIIMMGKKKNPFPYYKMCDAVLLSSEFEGYPVVFLEAMLLKKPILSTKVSDWEDLDKKFGMFCNRDEKSVYRMMKKYLDKGFELKEKFNYKEYNQDIESRIVSFIEDEDQWVLII